MPTLGSTVLLQQWTTGAHSTGCWSNEPWLANVSEHQLLHDKAKVTHTPLASADLWLEQGVQSMVRFSEECIWPDSTVILQSSTEHKRRYQLSLCQAPQLQSFTRRLHTALCPEHSEQYQTAVTPLGLRMPKHLPKMWEASLPRFQFWETSSSEWCGSRICEPKVRPFR